MSDDRALDRTKRALEQTQSISGRVDGMVAATDRARKHADAMAGDAAEMNRELDDALAENDARVARRAEGEAAGDRAGSAAADESDGGKRLSLDLAASRARAMEHLRHAIATVERVVAENEALARQPGHEASAMQRIKEGHEELATMQAELETLEAAGGS